ncbi:MAG: xanthine dehydrogenase family protein molybdopterin-binding subunit [Firmicutes bacterium]|nr:xanthine dehydrogenase family protein molybdopterin-binding subunit [Bacillota bacterium]
MAYRVVGRSVARNDVIDKVTGRAKYAPDVVIPHMLHGKILFSPYASARIINIDTSLAKSLLGVRAVITGKDVPYTYGSVIKDRPIFAQDVVRYQGEPIVGIVADSEVIAEEALNLIKIEYEEKEPILDPFEAMKADSSLLHADLGSYQHNKITYPEAETNICSHYKLRKGNVDDAFEKSDYIFEGEFSSQMIQHAFIEPIVAVADADNVTKRITIWSTACNPFVIRKELSSAFNIPMGKIRMIVNNVGGSFGGKAYSKIEPHVAALSLACSAPVRLALTREEVFNLIVRGPGHFKIKTGLMKDGTIVARKIETVWDTGAYAECGPVIARNSGHTAAGPYRIPNVKIDAYCVYTNKNIAGAFRGYGVQEATWAVESHMDDIAREMDIDPYDLRKKNILHYGDEGATGQIVEGTGLEQCLDAAWEAVNRKEIKRKSGSKLMGRGMACVHKATLAPSVSSAIIKLSEDGTATLLTSTTEQGQGATTVMAQIIAEELGLPYEEIYVSGTDTDYTPYDTTTTASRSTFSMGNAVLLAARDIKEQLMIIAAEYIGVDKDELTFEFGKIKVSSQPEKSYTIKEIVSKYYGLNGTLIGRGLYRPDSVPEDSETGQSTKITPFWMYGTQAAEVEIDIETGEINVLKLVAAHDMGSAINPMNCRQQLEGAALQGIGNTLYEEIKLNDKGITVNPNFHDYKIPTAMDSVEIESILIESQQKDGPYGAKGVGEPALAPTGPAIRNAILDALNIGLNHLPLTQEKILAAIEENKEKLEGC